ncbi:tyrosine-type recombinase/integrase [Sphingobium sufflavum]|uniref:site-specific integrase n=1 Tax=Sphingobium sufflavum TaxID=1129547 RepID=UPI001F445448|nr:tyrosine-type recombinase/integrase [Sphingobium sufflavum]MCE7797898.1 tyrosine-type recombinase/integrase [Sphingobium sufflavum]
MRRADKISLPHVKRTTAKGRTYYYFNTGKTDEAGKTIFKPLPNPRDPGFGGTYAALLGHRNRKVDVNIITVSKLVDMYQRSPHFSKLAKNTRKIYDTYLTAFVNDFGPAEAALLERKDIVFAVDKRAETPGAANMFLKVARAMYLWARRRGHLTTDPCKDIELLEIGEHEPWPDALVEEALACDDDRVRLAVHLLYFTAQRIGDVLSMRWPDLVDGVLYVTQQKTRLALEIPLHHRLEAELARTTKAGMTIIAGQHGKKLSQVTVRLGLQEWAQKRGHKIVPHGLRKNAVNGLLEAGCSVPQTASISGQSMEMVAHYAKRRSQRKLSQAAIKIWEGNRK